MGGFGGKGWSREGAFTSPPSALPTSVLGVILYPLPPVPDVIKWHASQRRVRLRVHSFTQGRGGVHRERTPSSGGSWEEEPLAPARPLPRGPRGLEPGVLLPPPPSREVGVGQHWAGPLTAECLLIPVSWAETRSRHQVYQGGLGQVLGSNSVPGRCSDQLPSWKQQAVWGWLALAFQTAQGFSWWPRGYEQGARCPQHRQVEQRRVTRAPASGAAPHSALLGFPVLQASSSELTSARLPGSTSHIRPRPSLPIWGLLVTTENGGCLSPIIGASAFSIERQLFSVLWTRIKKTFSSVFPPSIGVM